MGNLFLRFWLSLSLFALFTQMVSAGKTHGFFKTETAGELSELIENSESESFDSITISGKIGGADLALIAEPSGKLAEVVFVDMTDVELVADGEPYRVIRPSTINTYTHYYYYSDKVYSERHDLQKWTKFYTDDLSYLFYNVTQLKDVRLPYNLRVLGEGIFSGCKNLESVYVPDGVVKIGDDAFNDCQSLVLTNCVLDVDSIGDNAFSNCKLIADTLWLDNVHHIGDFAFSQCSNLKCFVADESLEYIGMKGFYFCEKLDSVKLPATLGMLGEDVFIGTPWYNNLPFIDGVQYVGGVANSLNMSAITDGEVKIREGTVGLSDMLFSYSAVVRVILPKSLKFIGKQCFNFCSSLENIDLPDGLETIGRYAFWGCSGLKELSLPSSIIDVGDNAFDLCSGISKLYYNVPKAKGIRIFNQCTSLQEVTVGQSVRNLPPYFIDRCEAVNSVTVSEGLEVIGEFAFYSCFNLKDINLPSSLRIIGDNAFYGTGLSDVVIPDNVDSIGGNVLGNCNLKRVVVNANLRRTASSAFSGANIGRLVWNATACETKALIYADCSEVIVGSGVRSIPEGFMEECKAVNVNFESPSLLTVIPKKGFLSCRKLSEITLPSTIESIGDSAFQYCVKLQNVNFVEAVTRSSNAASAMKSIGDAAFFYCSSLSSIEIPDGVEHIGGRAFANCKVLKYLGLPAELVYIGEEAFSGCSALEKIDCPIAEPLQIDSEVFSGVPQTCILYVPEESLNDYLSAQGWGLFRVEGVPTDIDFPEAEKLVRIADDGLEFNLAKGERFEIFAPDGRCVYTGNGAGRVDLVAGIYMVCIGDDTVKVYVK